jgi:hypothetical protein
MSCCSAKLVLAKEIVTVSHVAPGLAKPVLVICRAMSAAMAAANCRFDTQPTNTCMALFDSLACIMFRFPMATGIPSTQLRVTIAGMR